MQHLLPSGLMNPMAQNLIGSGVVVHVPSFFNELKELEDQGLPNVRERIFISDRCHIVLDLHTLVDGLEEQELGGKSIGTTKRGIGPSYSTKATRSGVRIGDVFDKERFDGKIRELSRSYKLRFGSLLDGYNPELEIAKFDVGGTKIAVEYVLRIWTEFPRRTRKLRDRCYPVLSIGTEQLERGRHRGCKCVVTRSRL